MEPKFTPVNTVFIVINAAISALMALAGNMIADVIYLFGVMDWNSIINGGEYYRLLTSMFLHFGFNHLFQNMVVLFFIGCYLEEALGSVKYFYFYLLAGLGANCASLFVDYSMQSNTVSAGASGAIFGIVGGLLCIVLLNRGRYEGIGLPGMLLMIVGSLYYGFTSSGVDNVAHVGGLVSGFLLCFLFYRKGRGRKGRQQAGHKAFDAE